MYVAPKFWLLAQHLYHLKYLCWMKKYVELMGGLEGKTLRVTLNNSESEEWSGLRLATSSVFLFSRVKSSTRGPRLPSSVYSLATYLFQVLYGGPIMDFQCHDNLLTNKIRADGKQWGDDYHVYSVRWSPGKTKNNSMILNSIHVLLYISAWFYWENFSFSSS